MGLLSVAWLILDRAHQLLGSAFRTASVFGPIGILTDEPRHEPVGMSMANDGKPAEIISL
jgi:hypothetical protein